ncbi:MAG: SDR family NAD(P)-dependent oxidoreductase [Pseudomonadota bacterium]
MVQHKKVIITGASSGIGEHLARLFYKRGFDVGLIARREALLSDLAHQLERDYPSQGRVHYRVLDVSHTDQVADSISALIDQLGGLDIMVVNAGTTAVTRSGQGKLDEQANVFQVNLMGAVATIDAATHYFLKQGYGHLVGMSSVSAYFGIPGSAAYSSSKAALTNYLHAVRVELLPRDIKVSMIHPGFINTDFAPNMESRPFVISAEKAAEKMLAGILVQKKNIVVPGFPWWVLRWVVPLLPDAVMRRLF